MATARFAEAHRDSVQEYHERQNQDILFPLKDALLALSRAEVKDPQVFDLIESIRQKQISLPQELLFQDKNGQEFFNLSVLENPGMFSFRELQKISGLLELFRILAKDLTLSAQNSPELKRFKERRKQINESVRDEVVGQLNGLVEYEYELVGEFSEHFYETKEKKERYEEVQKYLQGITERLFLAAGMKQFSPQVRLTRSTELNAFVFTDKPDVSLEEILKNATPNEPFQLPIYIHFGLVDTMQSPDELAGVLAHEFSHLLQPKFIGSKAEDERQRLEYDADATGMKIADAAGFSPRGMLDLMKRFAQMGNPSLLQKFGWGTHPDTNRRIIELEKVFNSPDHIFPNAEKKIEKYPQNIQESLAVIKTTPKRASKNEHLREKEIQGQLEETLEQSKGYEVFFASENVGDILTFGKERLRNEILDQELAHGTLGYRELLVEHMKTYLLALELEENKKEDDQKKYIISSEGSNISWDYNSEGSVIEELDESVLRILEQKQYLAKGETETKYGLSAGDREYWKNRTQDEQNKVRSLLKEGVEIGCSNFEDFIDENNASAQKFWEALLPESKRGVPLTRGQHLQLFKRLLSQFVPQNTRYSDGAVLFQVRYEYEREYSVEVPLPQELRDDILKKVPVGLRAHRKDEKTEPKTQTITQKQTESETVFSSQKCIINTPYRLWEFSPDEQPPLLKNVTAIVQEKTIDSFREILIEDGMSDSEVGKDELSFILRCLQTNLLPFSIQRVSIPFLSRVITLLERKKLTQIFGGNPTMIDQGRIYHFRDYFTGIIAFGLKAKDEEEVALQNAFRKRIELNPTVHGQCRGGIGKRKNLHLEDWEEKYISIAPQVEGDPNRDEDNVGLDINDPKNLAVTERVWADNKDRVLKFFETGKSLGLENGTPFEFRSFEIHENDTKNIETALGSFLQKSGKFSAIEKKFFEPLLRFVVASRQFLSYTYREELLTNDSVNKIFEKEKERLYPTLELFIEEVAERLFLEYGEKIEFISANEEKRGMKKNDYKKLLSHVLAWMATTQDFLERAAEVNAVQGDPSALRVFEDVNPVKERMDSDEWYEFRPPSLHLKEPSAGEHYFPSVALETITHRLEILSKENPSAKKLLDKIVQITKEKGKQCLPDSVMRACLGQLSKFSRTRRGFGKEVEIHEMIELWRLIQEVYKDEWKNIEQYKRFDEQMAHWEWMYGNPFESLRVTEVPGLTFDGKEYLQQQEQESIKKLGLMGFFEEKFVRDNYEFQRRYKVDQNNASDISFSWPLFFDDLWNGVDIVDKCFKKMPKDKCERGQIIFEYIRKELHILVDNKDNWDRIKNMQPGFFREFLVAKKLEKMNIRTLEEIEPYLQYFESHSHEGSERNQVSALIEGKKYKVKQEKKKSLYEEVCREFGIDPDVDKIYFKNFEASRWSNENQDSMILSDRDFQITIGADAPQTSFALRDKIVRRYSELLKEAELQREQSYLPSEEEVFVFSDHVIENDQSQLEIGPTYRLRFAAQPLMDWHKNALESCGSLIEAEALFARVENVLPECHPLRDLFIKNQMAHEIWQLLTDHIDLPSLREMGIRFMSNSVHLPDVLDKFPLYHEVSFLKNYTLYEVEGLGNAIEQLPQHIVSEILQRIEKMYRQQISPDQAPALRRLLFDLEKKVTWPGLRVAQKNGEDGFEPTLERVLDFYKEPTFERDQILLDICMDLATSPEQIRKVWSCTRNEQMRWPDEREKASKRTQHETFERIRGMIGMMERGDRAQYILWMLGGDAPFAEKFSSEETGISLMSRRDVFWHMTPNERRELLYDLLLRQEGVFEGLQLGWTGKNESLDDTDIKISDTGFPRAERAYDMIRYFANNLFDLTFGDQSIDPDKAPDDSTNVKGKEMMQVIFRGMFLHQSESARRAELLINIVEAVGQAKQEERDLSPGELMKLLLEQIGVVGIKAAQILSEQPGLLPESIRKHLAELKDSGKKVSKQVPATYLQSTGWLDTSKDLHCASIEEEVGVASIKQVNKGVLSDGSEVAIKFKRPSIDKNFEQDLKVLRGVLKNLESKNFSIPVYLLDEIEKAIREELSFTHEVDNQMAMKRSLEQRQAKIELPLGAEKSAIPLVVTTPIRIPDVLYPLPESEEDLGLIVEQYVQGLSLKDIQKYKDASREKDEKTLEKMRERIQRLYGKSRLSEIEKKLQDINVDRFGANLGLELMRQIVQGGAFHADLHSGNIYIDFTPFIEEGELYQAKAVLIDLGSAGYSERKNMPLFVQEKTDENFSAKEDFRDFLTALFAPQIKTAKVAEIVNKYGGLEWNGAKVETLIGSLEDTSSKVKKIFYSILEEGKTMNDQFRYFLKAIATGAGHLDKLREVVQQEFGGNGGEDENAMITPKLMNEGLLNMDLLFEF